MATATIPPREAELLAPSSEGALYEEIDDAVVEKPPMSAFEVDLACFLQDVLSPFVRENRLGRAFMEMLFNLRPAVARSRRPDVAFVSAERWPLHRRVPRIEAWAVVPDLAVEIVSPSNSGNEIVMKIDEYFLAGAIRVWVVYPESAKVYVYDSPTSTRILTRGDALADEAVLPSFRLDLDEFFGPPEP